MPTLLSIRELFYGSIRFISALSNKSADVTKALTATLKSYGCLTVIINEGR